MNRSSIITLVILCLILALALLVTFMLRSPQTSKQVLSSPAGAHLFAETDTGVVRYTDIEGAPVRLRDYAGAPLLVLSWASWCPQCRGQLELLNTALSEYSDTNVVVLAINRKETKEHVQRYARTLPALPQVTLVIDTEDHFYTSVGGYAMPELVVYDARGEILEHRRGEVTASDLAAILEQLQ